MNQMVLRPSSFNELVQFAEMAARSSMVPAPYKGKPADIMLAVQMGSELGLAPMQAIQNIACVNGRPSVYGDAIPGLCKASPFYEDLIETFEHEDKLDQMTAVCVAKRKGSTPVTIRFSVADAKKAGLWGKSGPWTQYPKRMLQMRARGFACRDAFPDVLRGLISAEEASDIPVTIHTGPTIEAKPEPSPVLEEPTPQTLADMCEASLKAEKNGTKWLDTLRGYIGSASSVDELGSLRGLPMVRKAERDAPSTIRGIIREEFQKAVDRIIADDIKQSTDEPIDEETFPGDLPNNDGAAVVESV